MKYISTRNKELQLTPSMALIKGLADDGGLFVPEEIPAFLGKDIDLEQLKAFDYVELTARVLDKLLPDFGYETILDCVKQGYGDKFDVADKVEMSYADGQAFMELYHGPTSAFKDMALCLLPRLLTAACKLNGIEKETMILTATSGDTGKAALEGFADVPGTRIVVFYPKDGVSAVQKAQMVTQEGKNVFVCAVDGNFDDAQTGVKEAFMALKPEKVNLSSANSINIGRLAPQVSYYFWAYGRMLKDGKINAGDKLDFIVPTGNFGDILAGYFAKKMGLPVGKLICASNENKVLTDFITTGLYDKRREFILTSSPSMDILVSSNLERLLFMASGCDDKLVAQLMSDLKTKGFYQAPQSMMDEIHKDFGCAFAGDEESLKAIAQLWSKDHYLMDTHTAVAYCCAEKLGVKGVVLSTASPYKFAASILGAVEQDGKKLEGFDAIDRLEEITAVPAPARLKNLRTKAQLHSDVVKPEGIVEYVSKKAE